MAINQDIVEGKLKQAEGKAQDVRGDLTNNPEDDLDGKTKQAEGKIQEGFGKAKEAVREALK
ncbi:hypothetical protein CCAX7_58200 [Capsulimonas corticalis]|uniref:Uncharacterized protein n=1 Tax=Capsulimonas corticalis TaxID=2219043 RepID=A0A402D066_9BACT|nr:CsbD family protein [Capsulimonas corticalis]BDI33769.1 hypothetical protein CCAX7_58200 [Capsulimonas corticalis]